MQIPPHIARFDKPMEEELQTSGGGYPSPQDATTR